MRRLIVVALSVVAAALPLALPTAASAATGAPAKPAGIAKPADGLCTVNADAVRYRTGPGLGYPARGLTYAGALFGRDEQALANRPADDTYWDHGDLIGGPADVWIRIDFLNC